MQQAMIGSAHAVAHLCHSRCVWKSRPRLHQRWSDSPEVELSGLAAAYAFGLLKNHPYVDGNRRTALVVLVAFLDLNGIDLTATNAEAVWAVLAVAGGEITEAELATWIEVHLQVP